jgi:hypothetical protein
MSKLSNCGYFQQWSLPEVQQSTLLLDKAAEKTEAITVEFFHLWWRPLEEFSPTGKLSLTIMKEL